jgi:acyl carrier protein phosphodiesterase
MKKQVNKYSLKKYLEHLKIDIDRKLPCDVVEFSNQDYYSTSKKQWIKYKDMDLIHVLRSLLKDRRDLEDKEENLIKRNIDIKNKYQGLKSYIINDIIERI